MKELSFDELPKAVIELHNKLTRIESLLESKLQAISSPEPLLSIHEAASFLNLKVNTIYGLTQDRKIPFCKQGKRLYFTASELSEWVKSGRIRTTKEVSKQTIHNLKKK